MKYGIKCYTSDEVQERIETIYGEKTVGMNRMHVTKIGSFQVIPFQSPHNGTECDGFLIKHEKIGCLLFITDAEYCKYDFSKMGINHAMIECNYSEDYLTKDLENYGHILMGHLELEVAKRLIQTINSPDLRSVGLLHLSSQNGNPERFGEEIADLVDGLKQGRLNLARELSSIAEKHLKIEIRDDKKNNKISQRQFEKFKELLGTENYMGGN